MTDALPEKVADLVGGAARWLARAALTGAAIALAVGLAFWLVISLLDVTSGGAIVVVWFVVCLVPAASFLVLWRAMRRVRHDADSYAGDLRSVYADVRGTPERVEHAIARLRGTRKLRARMSALREVADAMKGSAETEESRSRFERLYATLTGIAPITASVGAVGVALLAIGVPIALVWALVT